MKKILLALIVIFAPVLAHATVCPSGYSTWYPIQVPVKSISASVSNYVMPEVGHAELATVANGGNSLSSGTDVIYCTGSNAGNLIPFYLVPSSYSATTGIGLWLVQIATVSNTAPQTIYVGVGKSSATDQSCGPSGSNNCGSTLLASYLQFRVGSLLTDITGNCTATNHSSTSTGSGGPLGTGYASFVAASSQYIDTGCASNATSSKIGVEALANLTSLITTQRLVSGLSGASYGGYELGMGISCPGLSGTANGQAFLQSGPGTGSLSQICTSTAVTTGTWHLWEATQNGSGSATMSMFLDGANVGNQPNTGYAITNSGVNVNIGRWSGGAANYFNGSMAMMAIYNGNLTASQMALDGAAWTNPAAFSNFNARLVASNLYVSASGNDSNDCFTTGTACLTLAHICPLLAVPGDQLLLHGTDSFAGPCTVPWTVSGTQSSPIIISNYGTTNCNQANKANCPTINAQNGQTFDYLTPPYISSGGADCIDMQDTEYVKITGINCKGNAWTGTWPSITIPNFGVGVQDVNTRTSGNPLRGVEITNNSFQYLGAGLNINARTSASVVGYDGVNVSYNNFDHIVAQAILALGYNADAGGPVNQVNNVYVGYNNVTNMPGNPNGGSNGAPAGSSQAFGINSGAGQTIEWNNINMNGSGGGNPLSVGGCGIAVGNARNCTIQFNEISNEGDVHDFDGCAIDLDQDAQNCEVAYNLSYNNLGPAVQFGSFGGKTTSGNRIHHNISYNDVRGYSGSTAQPAISAWGATASNYIYNNSIYIGPGYLGTPPCMGAILSSSNVGNVYANNICKVVSGLPMYTGIGTYSTSTNMIGNVYDASGGSLLFQAAGATTLAGWQANGSGYENLSGVNYGVAGSANWANLAGFSPPTGGFTAAPGGIRAMHNFDLTNTSAALVEGVDVGFLGTLLGPMDYHGSRTRTGSPIDAGASAYAQQSTGGGPGPITIQ